MYQHDRVASIAFGLVDRSIGVVALAWANPASALARNIVLGWSIEVLSVGFWRLGVVKA